MLFDVRPVVTPEGKGGKGDTKGLFQVLATFACLACEKNHYAYDLGQQLRDITLQKKVRNKKHQLLPINC